MSRKNYYKNQILRENIPVLAIATKKVLTIIYIILNLNNIINI